MEADLESLFGGVKYCREWTAKLQSEISEFAARGVRITNSRRSDMATWLAQAKPQADRFILPGLPRPPDSVFTPEVLAEMARVESFSGEVEAELQEDIPDRFGREAGGILNELRVQLDHLANVLARRNGANSDGSSFPILDDRAKRDAGAKQKVRQLSAEDQEAIWALQPYHGGDKILGRLHAGDIFRKHRRPFAIHVAVNWGAIGNGHVGSLSSGGSSLERAGDKAQVASYAQVSVELSFEPQLTVLEPPELAGQAVIPFLMEAADGVEAVIRKFHRQ